MEEREQEPAGTTGGENAKPVEPARVPGPADTAPRPPQEPVDAQPAGDVVEEGPAAAGAAEESPAASPIASSMASPIASSAASAEPARPSAIPAPVPNTAVTPAAPARPVVTQAVRPLALWDEHPEEVITIPRGRLAAPSRRDFLLLGAGAIAATAGAWWLLPDRTKSHLLPTAHDRLDTLAARVGLTRERREATLNRALTFDDDIAEALYSKDRRVRTYSRRDITPLRSNLAGQTPGPETLPSWRLEVAGLASGRAEQFTVADLIHRLPFHEQVTRLCCVEGWSAIAWWGGVRFADFLAAHPPVPGMKWAALRSANSLDGHGNVDPYFVSIDLETARHPQTLLATHFTGRPLNLAHGAPLRLLVPMKLGLKNIKQVTHITYVADEPPDYWAMRGYSKYDGL